MKVLFIGGTGIISSASSELAIAQGIDLYHLNRGINKTRPIKGIKNIIADIRNLEETKKALENHSFDVVVEWIAFVPEHIKTDIELFRGKTKQYIFISSASIYQTPPEHLPITEETPLENPFWEYSRNKIACENLLRKENEKNSFPYTIVRPSHTYDKTLLPFMGGFTSLQRMKKGKPVIVFDAGTSIWTLTHHKDFAIGLVGLLGNKKALNQAFHITNNELLSWQQIYKILAKELGVEPNLVFIPSEFIAKFDSEIGDGLLGDKMHSMIFDNSKIKSVVPNFVPQIRYKEGAKEVIRWFNENEKNLQIDTEKDKLFDKIIEKWLSKK